MRDYAWAPHRVAVGEACSNDEEAPNTEDWASDHINWYVVGEA
jgi:hypothetical protein